MSKKSQNGNQGSPQKSFNEQGGKPPQTPKSPNRVNMYVAAALLAGVVGYTAMRNNENDTKIEHLDYSEFLNKVDSAKVDNILIKGDQLSGDYYTDNDTIMFKSMVPQHENVVDRLVESDLNFSAQQPEKSKGSAIMTLFWMGLLGGMIYMMFRAMKMQRGAMTEMGKNNSKKVEKPNVTFADVAGQDDAKKDLSEVVEFLENPDKFGRLGANIPRGVLMEGPPGTGKTLMAKALAGEAGVPFFSASGSDFVEMFVGRGAARVRDLFKEARKNAPCIVFIDEIDAVGGGRKNGGPGQGGHDEQGQTLNAILAEMDGMDGRDGVIIIAATNRADMLDKALIRPGRFDRKVTVGLPDVRGRRAILEIHANKKRKRAQAVTKSKDDVFDKDVDFDIIAKATPGFSGADIENLINESAIFAARRDAKKISHHDIELARDKIIMGPKSNAVVSEKRKELVAWHEAAHAVVAYALKEHAKPIHKVTLIPRGQAAGALWQLPREDEISSKAYLKAEMAVAMAGRVGEEALYGEDDGQITAGAQSDIQQTTYIAEKMVTEWGLSKNMGMRKYTADQNGYMPTPTPSRAFGKAVGNDIDKEINELIAEAVKTARDIMKKYEKEHKALVDALYEYETLNAHDVDLIMQGKPLDRSPLEDPDADALGDDNSANDNRRGPAGPGKKLGLG